MKSMTHSFLTCIAPVILTFNEAPNIARVLDKLIWAKEIVVIDSGSTDETLEILSKYSNVKCVFRPFDTHSQQWNFALSQVNPQTPWVLGLDADYVLSDQLVEELATLSPLDSIAGYKTRFRYKAWDKILRGTLYPPIIALFRNGNGAYIQDGHTQRLKLEGNIATLQNCIIHDDQKSLSRWLWAQERYSALEAEHLVNEQWAKSPIQNRIRRMIFIAPWLVPLYCLTVKRGLLDGWEGIFYALQKGVVETILALRLIEAKLYKNRSLE